MTNYIFDLAIVDSTTFFAATAQCLLKSVDGGESWQDGLAGLGLAEAVAITAVVASPNYDHDQTLFAASAGAILRSTNGGNSWQAVALLEPAPSVSAFAISPNFQQDGTLFAATGNDGVFVSTNRGVSWTAWNFGLYDTNVNAIAVSPNFAEDKAVWIGTESNVFQSSNGGRAWRSLDFPIEAVPVLSLGAGRAGLMAGSAVSGLYQLQPDQAWQPLAHISGQIEHLQLLPDARGLLLNEGQLWCRSGDRDWQRVAHEGQLTAAVFSGDDSVVVGGANGRLETSSLVDNP